MSCGDSCVNANRSCEATAARWDGRRAVFVVHTGQRTESTLHKQNESRNTVIKECIFREKSSIYSCSFDFLDLHKNCSNTHTHTHSQAPFSAAHWLCLLSQALVCCWSPAGTFGCCVVMHNGFHTFTAKVCPSVCLWLHVCGCRDVKVCQDQARGGSGSNICQRPFSALGVNIIICVYICKPMFGSGNMKRS